MYDAGATQGLAGAVLGCVGAFAPTRGATAQRNPCSASAVTTVSAFLWNSAGDPCGHEYSAPDGCSPKATNCCPFANASTLPPFPSMLRFDGSPSAARYSITIFSQPDRTRIGAFPR